MSVHAVLHCVAEGARAQANPVRKEAAILQKMKAKGEEESKKEEDLHQKFELNCKNNIGTLEERIATERTDHENLGARRKGLTAKKPQVGRWKTITYRPSVNHKPC